MTSNNYDLPLHLLTAMPRASCAATLRSHERLHARELLAEEAALRAREPREEKPAERPRTSREREHLKLDGAVLSPCDAHALGASEQVAAQRGVGGRRASAEKSAKHS